ncbi:phage tail assembly protein [Budviciaceae bacterium BWR-B9]|uniref:Phage tail assembly protein n=1 Tax=Limnobaculum allomyrinae TaxID=2791986 RepID=A0ABS1IWP1_9GAMM|nr:MULTISPECIES: phage tail assembly protein [Limnobaculum]MBK5145936.1 phage tail assembly protein [Limnobaculum allomyrinae]MBV7694009.1 phage tail assembly protein [Limnobaculum sp. M2-1]
MSKNTNFLVNTDITLLEPLTLGTGETLTKLTMRVPRRKDMKEAQRHSKDQVESETFLFALLTGLTMEDIDQLTLADSAEISKTFRRLCGESADQS